MPSRMFAYPATAILLACVLGLRAPVSCSAADFLRLIPLPPSLWKIGDGWPLMVERFPPPAADGKGHDPGPTRYPIHVIVAGLNEQQFPPKWDVQFLLKGQAPAGVEGPYQMMVRQADGAVNRIGREGAATNDAVREVGEVRVVTAPPAGFPVEMFFEPLDYEQDEFKNAQGTLTLHRQTDGPTLTVEATYQPAGGEPIMVRQKWVQGEKWWRDYERYRGGRRELHAWLEAPAGVNPAHDKDTPPRPPTEPDDIAALRQDPRLQMPLTFDLQQPRLSDLTRRIQNATGVPLTLQDGLDRDTPKLGGQSFRGVPAWLVMRQTAPLVAPDAHWEKEHDGYQFAASGRPFPPSRCRLRA